jgi:hypothetical protein
VPHPDAADVGGIGVVAVVSHPNYARARAAADDARKRETERRWAQALERAEAYTRGERAAMERDDVRLLLDAVRTKEAT